MRPHAVRSRWRAPRAHLALSPAHPDPPPGRRPRVRLIERDAARAGAPPLPTVTPGEGRAGGSWVVGLPWLRAASRCGGLRPRTWIDLDGHGTRQIEARWPDGATAGLGDPDAHVVHHPRLQAKWVIRLSPEGGTPHWLGLSTLVDLLGSVRALSTGHHPYTDPPLFEAEALGHLGALTDHLQGLLDRPDPEAVSLHPPGEAFGALRHLLERFPYPEELCDPLWAARALPDRRIRVELVWGW